MDEKKNENARRFWLAALVVVLLLAGIFLFRQKLAQFDWAALVGLVRSSNFGWLALGIVIVLSSYLPRVLRWMVMMRPVMGGRKVPFGPVFSLTIIGFTAVVLFGRAGELVRPWLISRRLGVPIASQLAAWFLERVFDLMAVLVLFGVGLATFDGQGHQLSTGLQWVMQTGGWVIAVLGAACLVVLGAASQGHLFVDRLSAALEVLPAALHGRIQPLMKSFGEGLGCCQRPGDLALIIFYTALEWLAFLVATMCFFLAFPPTRDFALLDSLVYLGFVSFGSIIQIPAVGGGVQIVSALVLAQLFGLYAQDATTIAIFNWLASWVSVIPFGIALGAKEGVNWSQLRHVEEVAKPEAEA